MVLPVPEIILWYLYIHGAEEQVNNSKTTLSLYKRFKRYSLQAYVDDNVNFLNQSWCDKQDIINTRTKTKTQKQC